MDVFQNGTHARLALFGVAQSEALLYNFFGIVKMMPKVSIYYLMVISRVFLLIIGQKQSFFVIASTKNGIDMKCLDSQKPLCELGGRGDLEISTGPPSGLPKFFKVHKLQ